MPARKTLSMPCSSDGRGTVELWRDEGAERQWRVRYDVELPGGVRVRSPRSAPAAHAFARRKDASDYMYRLRKAADRLLELGPRATDEEVRAALPARARWSRAGPAPSPRRDPSGAYDPDWKAMARPERLDFRKRGADRGKARKSAGRGR